MSIELHSFTVALSATDPQGFRSRAEHRAWTWQAVSNLARAVRAAGMDAEARLRGHDRSGLLLVEATDRGAAFLRDLPSVLRVEGHASGGQPCVP